MNVPIETMSCHVVIVMCLYVPYLVSGQDPSMQLSYDQLQHALTQETNHRLALEKELDGIRSQLQSVMQSLNSYVQGYQDLRKKFDHLSVNVVNLTNSLTQRTLEHQLEVNNYKTLQREHNKTKDVITYITSKLNITEGKCQRTETLYTALSEKVENISSVSTIPIVTAHDMQLIVSNVTSVQGRLDIIESSLSTFARSSPVVAFRTRLTSTLTPQDGAKLIFDLIDFNKDNRYDRTTGVFTAPRNGIYIFMVTLTTRTKDPDAYLVQNGINILPLFDHSDASGSSDYRQASASVITHMVIGDKTWVEWNGGDSSIQNHQETVFCGFLLTAE